MHRAQESRYSILLTHSLLRFLVYKQPSPTFFLKRYVFELPLLTFRFICDIILKPRGRGGIGRRARLRIWWLSVQVQVLSPAPNKEDMPLWRVLFCFIRAVDLKGNRYRADFRWTSATVEDRARSLRETESFCPCQQKTHFCLPTKVRFLNDVCLRQMMWASPNDNGFAE